MDYQVLRIVLTLCEDVGTPRAQAVYQLASAGEWSQLQELTLRPQDYLTSETLWRDRLVTDVLRKCDLPSTVDREGVAVQTFLDCEVQNCATNVRLSRFLPEGQILPGDEAVAQFITEWRKEVRQIIGKLPDHLTPRFSGGATYADTGKLTTIPDKMSSVPTIYQGSTSLSKFWEETSWGRQKTASGNPLVPEVVRGNIFFTVPKDGTKFRGCCKESSINVALQLDVGKCISQRLKRAGLDLKTGQETHQRLAKSGSKWGHLATLDQSNASDTVCRVLPRLVLPDLWWRLLDSLRATHTRMNGQWHRLEKFSSMGNGFTFELETLLFWSLARTVVRLAGGETHFVSCYGDDLIVPADLFPEVTAALKYFGFTPNLKKTFGLGPFRESCGGDYYRGVPVRAFHLEELPDDPQKLISLANGLRRSATSHFGGLRWRYVKRAWFRTLDAIPSEIRRLRGPEQLGDIVIHDDRSTWSFTQPKPARAGMHSPSSDPSWDQEWVSAWVAIPEVLPWHHWRSSVQMASCTLGLPSIGVTPRGGVTGFRRQAVPLRGLTWIPSNYRGD